MHVVIQYDEADHDPQYEQVRLLPPEPGDQRPVTSPAEGGGGGGEVSLVLSLGINILAYQIPYFCTK